MMVSMAIAVFAGAAVADDELALAAADGDHGVDGLDTGLQRLFDRLAVGDAGSAELHRPELFSVDGTLAVNRLADGVDHSADHGLAHRHLHDAAGATDGVAFLDQKLAAEEHGADVVFLEVEDHAVNFMGKLQELTGHGLLQAMDAGDAVAHLDDGTDVVDVEIDLVALNLLLDDRGDFFRPQFHTQ